MDQNQKGASVRVTTITQLTPVAEDGALLTQERETVRVEALGRLTEETDGIRVFFSSEGTDCELHIGEGGVFIRNRGCVESEMRLSLGRVHESVYCVPPYRFPLSVRLTQAPISKLSARGGSLRLSYRMSLGGDERAVAFRLSAEPYEEDGR